MQNLKARLLLGAAFGLVVIIALLFYSDLRGMSALVFRFPIALVVPILLLTLFNYALRWAKWHYYLKVVGVSDITYGESAALWVSSFVLAVSPGKVAELLKAVALRVMTGTPVARGAPIVVAERVTDGLAMFVLAAVGLGGLSRSMGDTRNAWSPYLPAFGIVLFSIVAGVALIQARPLVMWALRQMNNSPHLQKVGHSLIDLYDSAHDLFKPTPLLFAVALGVISWAGECVGFFLILWGLGLEPSWTLMFQATLILATATILGGISGLPGGLGAAEASIAYLVQVMILREPDPAFAGTATLLARVCTLWFAVLLGLVTALLFRRRLFPQRFFQVVRESQGNGTGDKSQ